MVVDQRVAGFLGRVLDDAGGPVGTCFQVAPGVVVTAWHVLDELGAGNRDAVVRLDPLQGGEPTDARVTAVDPVHDLAALSVVAPLSDSVAGLAATDEVHLSTAVSITGAPTVADQHTYRHLDAVGAWAGGTTRDDQVPLGRLTASAVLPGMSGAPVLAASGLVVGVVSGRYNSADGWLRDSVWVARTENLAPLLVGLAEIASVARPTTGRPLEVVLSIDDAAVRLSGPGVDVTAEHRGVPVQLEEAMRGLRRTRSGLSGSRGVGLEVPLGVSAGPAQVGELMAAVFLPDPVAAALAGLVADAKRRWTAVRFGIRVVGVLRGLPWEALALPEGGGPVALHPLVVAYRQYPDAAPVAVSPGPLRVVVAISSPFSGGGGVLDYERELRNILAAVRGARQGDAQVRVVHFATTAEIYAFLRREPAHVLHLSGHGRPGLLELEDDDGDAREVTAEEFVTEAIPAGAMPPVIVLAACHTDAATATGDPSFAAALIAHGVSVVLGTETSVTDVYATRMFTRIYESLVNTAVPDVVAAVAGARRTIQGQLVESREEREKRLAGLDEWAVVTVSAAAGSVVLFDPSSDTSGSPGRPKPSATPVPGGLLSREIGEFVGRRRAQRRWPAELLAAGSAGLVLHGIGGVGKTTLAAELVRRITDRDPDRLVVIGASGLLGGETSVDQVLAALGSQLRFRLRDTGTRDMLTATELAQRVDMDWQQRWRFLRDHVLGEVPVLLVLDNFEDNLTADSPSGQPGWRSVRDEALAELLAALVGSPGRCRLLVTTRYPFPLPGDAHRTLTAQHIGPLSTAETMKLAWALPALDRLTETELDRVCRMVGGHPRCLEYLDALLSAGQGAYPDVTTRLATALTTRLDIKDLPDWFARHRELEPALAEAVTLAADDVLLAQLLAGLEQVPGAVELVLGASVYRAPVDLAGLLFQVGEPDPTAASTPDGASAAEHIRIPTPPRRAPDDLTSLVEACTASSLLALDTHPDQTRVFVHRWTATELHRRWTTRGHRDRLTDAHQRAAEYWQWRVQVWPQDQAHDLEDTLEARHHLLQAGQPDHAGLLTENVCIRLHAWGAWDREEALVNDTLSRLSASSPRRAAWIIQLGDIALGRGRTIRAAEHYRQALTIAAGLVEQDPANTGFRRDLSISYERLADLARAAGQRDDATAQISAAVEIRTVLQQRGPRQVDLAEELAATLAQQISITGQTEPSRADALGVLEPFERQQLLTSKGTAVLEWLRKLP
ncbi:MAG: trypsin-like peptidase domain-containing protein [Pseudonocardia sp.]